MPLWLKATGIGGSILVLIALAIAFFKQLIALIGLLITFIGFLTFAIKAVVILAFILLILGVGIVIIRSWGGKRRHQEQS